MKVFISVLLFLTLLINSDAYRIFAVFPFQGRSHQTMFDAIIKVLARRGHQVDVMTHFPLKKPIPNYKVVVNLENEQASLANTWDVQFAASLRDITSSALPTTFGNDICRYLRNPDLQKIIKYPPNDPPYDLVIAEAFGSPCYIGIGWALKVPVILAISSHDLSWLTNLLGQPTNTAFYPEIYSDYFYPMSFFERVHNTLQSHKILFDFLRFSDDVQNVLIRKYIDPNIPSLNELKRDVVLALVNSFRSLHGVRPLVPALIEVGGLHVREHYEPLPSELEQWMNKSTAGVVYFTLGSMVNIETFPDDVMRALYSVFKKLVPVRVLMKVANEDKLLTGLPSNVKISSWIPQVAVLEHKNTKVFITHGGLMGTLEALTFGVPMIGIPLFADQFSNLNSCIRKDMALKLEYTNLTENSIYYALNEMLNNPKYQRAAKHEAALFLDRPLSAENATVFWTEYAIRHGPGALRSPTVDMSWWQVALLDVYMFIMVSILFGIYVIYVMLRMILSIFCLEKSKQKKLRID